MESPAQTALQRSSAPYPTGPLRRGCGPALGGHGSGRAALVGTFGVGGRAVPRHRATPHGPRGGASRPHARFAR